MPYKTALLLAAFGILIATHPARASSLFFSRTVLSNTTEAACFKTTADNARKIFTNFKASSIDSAGTLDDPKFAGIFVSVTCVGQGANTMMLVMAAGNNSDATASAMNHVTTLMVLGFGPIPASK